MLMAQLQTVSGTPKIVLSIGQNTWMKLGYRMPAEWEPHRATWLALPHDRITWPKELSQVEAIYIKMIRYLHQGEEVHVLVNSVHEGDHVSKMLRRHGIRRQVFFHRIKTQGTWIRDYGPIFVVNRQGKRAATRWKFNAWGEKYKFHKADGVVSETIARRLGLPFFKIGMVLEGGSIDVNGNGTLLTPKKV